MKPKLCPFCGEDPTEFDEYACCEAGVEAAEEDRWERKYRMSSEECA